MFQSVRARFGVHPIDGLGASHAVEKSLSIDLHGPSLNRNLRFQLHFTPTHDSMPGGVPNQVHLAMIGRWLGVVWLCAGVLIRSPNTSGHGMRFTENVLGEP